MALASTHVLSIAARHEQLRGCIWHVPRRLPRQALLVRIKRQGQVPLLLLHLVPVALEVLGDLDAEDEGLVTMRNRRLELRVRDDIGAFIARRSASKPIQRHRHKLAIQERVEEVLERLADAVLGHRYLPQVALEQVRVRLHRLLDRIVFFVGSAVQNLLQDGHYVLIVVALARQSVDNCA